MLKATVLGATLLFSTPAHTATLPQVQRAVSDQLRAVGRYYPEQPVNWANIHIVPSSQISADCGGVEAYGCNDGTEAWVADDNQMSRTYSHEAIEIATGRQICDAVSWRWYWLDGVRVSAWVQPSHAKRSS